jgi:hypothetical protein
MVTRRRARLSRTVVGLAAGVLVAACAAALDDVAVAGSARPVVVASGKTPLGHAFRLLAYDRRTRLCTELLMPALSLQGAACGSSVPRSAAVRFQSVQSFATRETLFSGVTATRVTSVGLALSDGRQVSAPTRRSGRYGGRYAGNVRFWATSVSGLPALAALTAKDARGGVVQAIQFSPPPAPAPPPPPPPPPCYCCCIVAQGPAAQPCPVVYPQPPCY